MIAKALHGPTNNVRGDYEPLNLNCSILSDRCLRMLKIMSGVSEIENVRHCMNGDFKKLYVRLGLAS